MTVAKAKKPRITIQMIPRRMFAVNPRCKPTASGSKKTGKTPLEKPKDCVGSVRLGQDGKHLYIARRVKKHNPTIKYSSVPTGRGFHIGFKWQLVYDARTGKAFRVSDLPPGFPALS